MTTSRRPASYGPIQLADLLGLTQWQLERALRLGLIPPPDRAPRRWSAAIAERALAHADDIRAKAGSIPDLGANRAAAILSTRLGVDVHPDTIEELARMGVLTKVGDYKGHPLFSGQDLERFTDRELIAAAAIKGRLLTADAAAGHLGIRRSDFDHLTRARWVKPARYGQSSWSRRDRYDVPLYRTADLDMLLDRPTIDWDAVRATPKGRTSPLARLTTARENGPDGTGVRG